MNSLEILGKFGVELEHQRLIRGGVELLALCPFHEERTASFSLNLEKGVYKCFGCQARGHITQLIVHMTNLTMPEVQQALKGELPEHYQRLERHQVRRDRKRYLSDIEVETLTRYVEGLHTLLKGKHGLKLPGLQDVTTWQGYLTDIRGLSWGAIEHFKLGANCLPNYGKYFADHARGYPTRASARQTLMDLNLFNRRGGDYWWKPAIIIPYMGDGLVYFCNARMLPGDDEELRYLGMKHLAREMLLNEDALDQDDEIYAIEGEFNAMKMWDVGFKNVCSFGGKEQFNDKVGKFYGKSVVLYFDADRSDPEFKSRQRAVESLQNVARSVSYFELPQGVDPDDYLNAHTKEQFEGEILSRTVMCSEFQPGEYRELPEAERRQVITLAEAQSINRDLMKSVASNLPAYSGKRILNNMPIGTAKTTGAIDLLNATKDDPALVLTSTHYLATDYDDAVDFDRFTVHLIGRSHRNVECPYASRADYWTSRGYSLYFKRAYCLGVCEKSAEDCLHIKLQEAARTAPVLIATHAHGQLKEFFTSAYYGNNRRKLIIIDEEAELIRNVYFRRDTIAHNIEILERAALTLISKKDGTDITDDQLTGAEAHALAEVMSEMEQARLGRVGYKPEVKAFTRRETYTVDRTLCSQIKEGGLGWYDRNMLHDLVYVINNGLQFYYDHKRDALYYTWRARFPQDACVLFLTGTTPEEYLERTLDIVIDIVVGEQYYIRRENLKVIQLLNLTGGRQRVLYDKALQANIREFFRLCLAKHGDQYVMVITSQGAGIRDAQEDGTAKEQIVKMLQPTAIEAGRLLVPVATEHLEQGYLPLAESGKNIPVIHYGTQGTNLFAGYEVLIELNAHYYHQSAIVEGVRRNFGVDVSDRKPVKQTVPFRTLDREYQVERYTYGVPEVDLFIEATQKADIVQAEGRGLRGEDTPKVIYRLHNVNVEPYANRVYKSWQSLFREEFGSYEIAGKMGEVLDWIRSNIEQGQEFTTRQVCEAVGGYVGMVNKRYMAELHQLGYISNLVSGPGRGRETRWKRVK